MKNTLMKMNKIVIITLMMLTVALISNAQPTGTPGTSGSGIQANGQAASNGPVVPFDGGMSLMLLASGVGYASKKLKRKK
jgi:hypothetical protein